MKVKRIFYFTEGEEEMKGKETHPSDLTKVTLEELIEISTAKYPENYIISGVYIPNKEIIFLVRGNGQTMQIPCKWFKPNPVCKPDFNDLEIIDCGQAIRLGKYEVGADTILKEFG